MIVLDDSCCYDSFHGFFALKYVSLYFGCSAFEVLSYVLDGVCIFWKITASQESLNFSALRYPMKTTMISARIKFGTRIINILPC